MAYTKQTWRDLPNKTTPINASRLGHMEDGIYDAAQTADSASSAAASAVAGLDDKVDKVTGKGLSTNDFTDTLKTKLDNIETGAEVNVQSDWDEDDSSSDAFIQNKPTLGTAATKNSTSVVTQSTDLVESGAVESLVGWGNKNLAGIFKPWNVNSSGVISEDNTYKTAIIKGEENDVFTASNETAGAIVVAFYSSMPVVGSTSYNSSREVYSNITSATFTFPINGYAIVRFNLSITKAQIEKGSTATAYEPYHASVEETLTTKTDNSVIAPVENGTNASQAWSVGQHFMNGGVLKEVTNAIPNGEPINSGNSKDVTVSDLLEIVDVTSEFTFADDITFVTTNSFSKIYRVGNIIIGKLRFTTPSTVVGDKIVLSIPSKYTPKNGGQYLCNLSEQWTGTACGVISCTNNNTIVINSSAWTPNKTVLASFMYVI